MGTSVVYPEVGSFQSRTTSQMARWQLPTNEGALPFFRPCRKTRSPSPHPPRKPGGQGGQVRVSAGGLREAVRVDFEQARRAMVAGEVRTRALPDLGLIAAMLSIPREACGRKCAA